MRRSMISISRSGSMRSSVIVVGRFAFKFALTRADAPATYPELKAAGLTVESVA
jgi:hypothetical protein